MKTTYRQLLDFNAHAQGHLRFLQEHPEVVGDTKVTYALNRMLKRIQPIVEEYQDEIQDLRIEHAVVDEKTKAILRDTSGNYQFTKEGERAVNKGLREILARETEEFEPFYTDQPEGFYPELTEIFTGFIFKESDEQKNS